LREFPHGDSSEETSQISTDLEVSLNTAGDPWAVAEAPSKECSREEVAEAPPVEYVYN
jgi:hypothetical protein